MIDEIAKFLVEIDYIPDESLVDAYYDPIFFIKYMLSICDSDIERIKNCSDDEYETVVKEELENKANGKLKNNGVSNFFFYGFKKNHKEIFEFIDKKIDLSKYNFNYGSGGRDNNDYIDSLIDWNSCNKILSVFSVYFSKKKKKNTTVDVIFSYYNNIAYDAYRNEICDFYGYSYNGDINYPIDLCGKTNKDYIGKYDFVYCDLVWNKDLLNVHGISPQMSEHIDENDKRVFIGDNYYENIYYLKNLINDNGKAVLRVPYAEVSKLPAKLVDKNIIEEIVFMPKCEEWDENFETQYTNFIYIVVSNSKVDDKVKLTDYANGTHIVISNNAIKGNGGLINIAYYQKYDNKGYRMFDLKNDNKEQLNIIAKETEKIDKMIDEFDLK